MPARRTYSQALRAAGLFTVVLAFSLWAAADQPRLRWIVELDTRPLAMVDHNEALKQSEVLSPEQALAQSLSQIEPRLRRDIVPAHTYRHVTTGFALALTEAEANELADLPAVLRVTPDTLLPLDVPRSSGVAQGGCSLLAGTGAPEPVTRLIGAVDVWNGALPDGLVHLGEGVIVGVVGDGIRGDHPSFAALGDDGYQHINPYGSGVYVGECFATPELVCNDKLIGRYDFTGDTSEDDSGYSTFLSSIAVGNRLSGDTVAGTGLALVAGVAPHANLIAYRACAPSCALSAIISAFDQAVADGVDVLLYPIGSNSESPWTSLLSLVARSLRAAGVVVVSSTGSAGPEPGSLNLSMAAPWVVSANPSTHGLDHYAKMLGKFAGGASVPPPALTGRARGEGISRRIVYAGSIPNPAAPGEDPAQCLTPYPAGVLNGEILVCDRGQISRAQKSRNARDSGAGGFVLANVSGGLSSLASDNYAIPGIHIDADAATTLRAWLATGQGHRATISGTMLAENSLLEDRLSGAASRGPNLGLSYLAPTLTAPAFDITGAALAPARFTLFAARGNTPAAGALALLASVHPSWTVSERVSALMTTAVAPLREIDSEAPTGPFGHGAGRIDVAAATRAGLVLDITDAEFVAADPALGGRPQALNLAGLVDLDCVGSCRFVRTLRATTQGAWVASAVGDGLAMAVEPAQFALNENETVSITVDVQVLDGLPDANYAGYLTLTPQAADVSSTTFPVAIGWRADADGDVHADLNGDGWADGVDLALMSELFSRPPGPSGMN